MEEGVEGFLKSLDTKKKYLIMICMSELRDATQDMIFIIEMERTNFHKLMDVQVTSNPIFSSASRKIKTTNRLWKGSAVDSSLIVSLNAAITEKDDLYILTWCNTILVIDQEVLEAVKI